MLAWAPRLTLLLLLAPVVAGFLGTLLPAIGYLPELGRHQVTLDAFDVVFATPGVGQALIVSLVSAFGSTLLALLLAVALLAILQQSFLRAVKRFVAPLVALPHLAAALGLAFLIAPAGWFVRLGAPWLEQPPTWVTVQDANGLALMIGLALKEAPFLLLMLLSALNQVPAAQHLSVASALGYRPAAAWFKLVFPLLWPQLRLPVYAVFSYGLGNVEMASVLGPTTPPSFAVLVLRWAQDGDLAQTFPAAAGALLQAFMVVIGIAILWLLERAAARLARGWLSHGQRHFGEGAWRVFAKGAWRLLLLLAALGAFSQLLWSFAQSWRFPAALPQSWSLQSWSQLDRLAGPTVNGLLIALATTSVALVLALACLEQEKRQARRPRQGLLWLLYLPLLLPQASFLFGLQTFLITLGAEGRWVTVIWAHLVFVFPYVFLTLADPVRALDDRYRRSALSLGATPWRHWWQVEAPLLLRPLLTAGAIGVAVSLSQYLATLFPGAGRITTLTTEAMALAGGGERRVLGLYGTLLTLLPLIFFALAQAIPAWRFRHRAALRGEG